MASRNADDPTELPATLENVMVLLKRVVAVQAIDTSRVEGLGEDMRWVKNELELHKRERRRLSAIAARLSTETLKLAAAKALATVAPTPARFFTVLAGSFAGGFAAYLALSWWHAIQFASVALVP